MEASGSEPTHPEPASTGPTVADNQQHHYKEAPAEGSRCSAMYGCRCGRSDEGGPSEICGAGTLWSLSARVEASVPQTAHRGPELAAQQSKTATKLYASITRPLRRNFKSHKRKIAYHI